MKMYFFNEMPFYLLFKSWTPRTTSQLLFAWIAIFALGVFYEFLQMAYGQREAAFWARRAAIHTAAAAATASQQGMDEELGGPLAEGVSAAGVEQEVKDVHGRSCCSSKPPLLQQVAVPAAPAAAGGGKGACCAGGGGAVAAGHYAGTPRPDSAASCRSSGSNRKGLAVGGGSGCGCCAPAKRRARGSCLSGCAAYMDPELVAMDVVRGIARFVLAGLAYLLMLAAMSFNVAIFFAVITGVAVGSMLFGRWRWNTGTAEGYSHCGCGSS